jgi:hypothetical protein
MGNVSDALLIAFYGLKINFHLRAMRKLLGAAVLLFALARCTEKPDAPAPYKPSFDFFEISYHSPGTGFALRVDSNKAFIANYGNDETNFCFGMLPDSLMQYFDSSFNRLKADSSGLEQKVYCDDCSCIAVIITKSRDSIMGLTCEWRESPGNLAGLADRIDSFMRKQKDFKYGYVYFPTMSTLVTMPPKITAGK